MARSRLGRTTTAQRKALIRDLVTALIIHEQIETTEARAKELKRVADKMITLGKKNTLAARRRAAQTVRPVDAREGQTVLQNFLMTLRHVLVSAKAVILVFIKLCLEWAIMPQWQ